MSKEAGIFFAKKSYELCYAIFRISSCVKNRSFADSLERHGLALVEAGYGKDCHVAEIEIGVTCRLIKLGSDLGLIGLVNAEIISKELGILNSAIAELANDSAIAQDVSLDGIFSVAEPANGTETNPAPFRGVSDHVERRVINSNNVAEYVRHETVVSDNDNNGGASRGGTKSNQGDGNKADGFTRIGDDIESGVARSFGRKSAVLERIRQNGNCRLREIQEVLPEVSERTIRYDVQNLIEQGLVERVGNGGPATYYKVAG